MKHARLPSPARAGLRATAWLASGSGVAAALAYAAQPLLSRLYTPEAFGVADLFAALLAVAVPAGSLRYDDALILPERDEDAVQLAWLSAGLSALFALAVLAASLLPVARASTLGPYVVWLAPALLLFRLGRLSEMWLTRTEHFAPLSAAPIARTTATTGWRIAGGVPPFGASPGGLIYGYLAGQVAALAVQAARLRPLRTRPHLGTLRSVAWRYRRFALLTTPAVLLNNLTSRLPVFALAWAFSADVVGLFGRVLLAFAVPLSLVGGALGRVLLPEAAAAHRRGGLGSVARRFHDRLAWLGVYPALLLVLAGPDLFAFVFGEPWREAGAYARWLAPWLLLSAIGAPLTALFDVAERHRLDVATSIVQFVLLGAALAVGLHAGTPLFAIAAVGGAGVLGRAVQLAALWRVSGQRLGTLPERYLRPLAAAVPGAVLTLATTLAGRPWLVFAAAAIGAAPYYALAWRREKRLDAATP